MFLYWVDILVTWAKTFFIPDLYSAHTKNGETFNFINMLFFYFINMQFLFVLTLDFN